MKKLLFLTCFLNFFIACKKEYSCQLTKTSCHGDTTKQLVITDPRSEDTLRIGKTYELRWIGRIKNATEYRVWLKIIDYNLNLQYSELVGFFKPTECAFKWKLALSLIPIKSSNDCYIVLDGLTAGGHIESDRFSIRP